jgi:hypothetical protein
MGGVAHIQQHEGGASLQICKALHIAAFMQLTSLWFG